jgi:hypothetical protein
VACLAISATTSAALAFFSACGEWPNILISAGAASSSAGMAAATNGSTGFSFSCGTAAALGCSGSVPCTSSTCLALFHRTSRSAWPFSPPLILRVMASKAANVPASASSLQPLRCL